MEKSISHGLLAISCKEKGVDGRRQDVDNIRGAQSRSARPRTSVAQHSGVFSSVPWHRGGATGGLRLIAGVAMVEETATRVAATMVEKRIVECFG